MPSGERSYSLRSASNSNSSSKAQGKAKSTGSKTKKPTSGIVGHSTVRTDNPTQSSPRSPSPRHSTSLYSDSGSTDSHVTTEPANALSSPGSDTMSSSGKTTFLEQAQMQFVKGYKAKALDKITTTVGLNIGKIDISSIRLMFWDLGGQEELQALWDKYYAESHGVIYVVDSSDPARLEESRIAFEQMLESEALMGVPLLVFANKQDVEGHLPSDEVKKEFNKSAKLMGHRACRLQPVSALTGDGVHEGIAWLVDSVKHNAPWRPPREAEIH